MSTETAEIGEFEQIEESKDLSQLVRSNTVHYWTAMRGQVNLAGLKRYLDFQGMLAGDPHAGNFGVLPLRSGDGVRKMRYVNIDFDDAGRGPFVLDFIRFVIASKATDKEVKRRPQEKAYLKGLAGEEIDPPKKVRELLHMPVSEYRCARDGISKQKVLGQGLHLQSGHDRTVYRQDRPGEHRKRVSGRRSDRCWDSPAGTRRKCGRSQNLGAH